MSCLLRAGILARASGPALVVIIACVLAGCSSQTAYKTASTLGPGRTRLLVAPQVNTAATDEGPPLPYPELAIAAQHGMTEAIDVGGSLAMLAVGHAVRSFALEGSVKHHLYTSASGRIELAVGAGLGYRATMLPGTNLEAVHASVPFIVGVNLGAHQLVLSPHVSWQRWYSEGTRPLDVPALGTSVGLYWQISRKFALHPEISVARTPIDVENKGQAVLGHFGIALVFGRPAR